MKIAVLLSSYNGEKYIKDQIDSILQQDFTDQIDLIVRDDGSTDSTIDILAEYQNKGLLTYYIGKNIGASNSFFNLLINCGEYDYYAFSDQDDVWKSDKISKAINELSNVNNEVASLYYSNATLVDDELNVIDKKSIFREIPRNDFFSSTCFCYCLGCTSVINNAFAKIIRLKGCPKQIIMHDTFLEELCFSVGGKCIYDHYESVLYRQHSDNVSGYCTGGIIEKINHRIKFIFNKRQNGIAEQAQSIIDQYSELVTKDKLDYLTYVSRYKKSILNRIKLGLDKKINYKTINTSFMYRMAIILGNL